MMPAHADDPLAPAPAKMSWIRLAALLVVLAACAAAQWYIAHGLRWSEATPLLVVGALVAAVLLGSPDEDAAPEDIGALALTRRPVWLVVAVAGFGVFAFAVYQLCINWARNFDSFAPVVPLGLAVWTSGLVLWESPQRPHRVGLSMPRWEVVLFLAVVALGFFLRFYRFPEFPPPDGFCAIEEPQAGQIPYLMQHEHYRPWEFLGDRWLGVAAFDLMGRTITAVRIPFIIVSGLTVIALYLLLRQLVSRPAALFATALFATARWHLIYARYAHNIFAPTLVVVIIYYLCVRAHKGARLALYPWLGFLSAYTLYTYAGYRGTTAFVALFFVISLFVNWRAVRTLIAPQAHAAARRRLNREVAGLSLAAVGFAGALLPLAFQLRTNPTFFFEAAVRATDDPTYYSPDRARFIEQVINRARATAMIFNHQGDSVATFNLPDRPMLDPISGVLFTMGLAYCLIQGRRRFQGYFAFTFLLLLFMGSIFVHNFDVRRLQGIIPLIFVLVAFFVDRLWQVVTRRFGRGIRPLLVGGAVVAFGFAFWDNYTVYFRGMMGDMRIRSAFENAYTIGIRYLHQLPTNAYLLIFSDTLNFFMPSDYEWWRGEAVPGKVTSDIVPILEGQPGPWSRRELHLFIVDPFEHADVARLLAQRIPAAHCSPMTAPDLPSHLRFSTCDVPLLDTPNPLHEGIRARYFRGDAPEPIVDRLEPAIGYALFPDVCRFPMANEKPPCRAEWSGAFTVPAEGRYDIRADVRDGTISMTIDDQPVSAMVQIPAGPHSIHVQAKFRSIEDVGAEVRWFHDNRWELVPFATLQPVTP